MDLLPGLARKRFALRSAEKAHSAVSRQPTSGLDARLRRYSTDEHLAAGRVGAQCRDRDPPTQGLDTRLRRYSTDDHAVRPTARSMNSAADQPKAVVAVAPSRPVYGLKYSCGPPPVDHERHGRSARRARASGCPDARESIDEEGVDVDPDRAAPHALGREVGIADRDGGNAQGVANSSRVLESGHEAVDDDAREGPGEQRHAGSRPCRSATSVPAAAGAEASRGPRPRGSSSRAERALGTRTVRARHRASPKPLERSRRSRGPARTRYAPRSGARRRKRAVEDRAVVEARGVRMPVLRQAVVIEVG